MLPGLLVGVSLVRSTPALSTEDAEVLRSFFRIQQIVKKINISGFLSEPPNATLDTESKGVLATEQNRDDPGQGTTAASLGESNKFLEDKIFINPTTTTTTPYVETEETTTDPNDYYDTSHTVYPMYALPCDYSHSERRVVACDEMYDLQKQDPTELSTPAEELETLGGEVKENSDVDSEEDYSGRGRFSSGSELTKLDSGKTFEIALLALK